MSNSSPILWARRFFSRALWRRSLSVSGYLLWSYDPAMQTPSPAADSVPSLWRSGLRLAAGGREEAGGGGALPGSYIRAGSLSHARKKSWLIVSPMAPRMLWYRTTNRCPLQYSTSPASPRRGCTVAGAWCRVCNEHTCTPQHVHLLRMTHAGV
jgi:hypothetical protein